MVDLMTTGRDTIYYVPTSGELAKQLREARGLGLREAARNSGLTHQTIINLERAPGTWDKTHLSTLRALARTYAVPFAHMIDIANGKEPTTRSKVDPRWVEIPVRKPGDHEVGGEDLLVADVAYVPTEHLQAAGATVETAQAYRITRTTFVSEEVRADRYVRAGDLVIVDPGRDPRMHDLFLAYWAEVDEILLVRQMTPEMGPDHPPRGIVRPLDPRGLPRELDEGQTVTIIGPVIWRGG